MQQILPGTVPKSETGIAKIRWGDQDKADRNEQVGHKFNQETSLTKAK